MPRLRGGRPRSPGAGCGRTENCSGHTALKHRHFYMEIVSYVSYTVGMNKTLPCSKCLKEKALDEFYKSHTMKRGYQNKCKLCMRLWEKSPSGIAAKRKWVTSTKGKISHRKRNATYCSKAENRPKISARQKLVSVLRWNHRKQRIDPRPDHCSRCFVTCIPMAHHDDYSKPLEVTWLCFTCHERLHHPTPITPLS